MRLQSTMKDRSRLAITIYNDNFGVVKETRNVNVTNEITEVLYLDVAEKIETDSILVDGLKLLEMNYDYDLVSKEKLLEKYLDQHVYVMEKETKAKKEYRLLSVSSGLVLENVQTKEIVVDPEGELILPGLPGELIVRPSLIWKVVPQTAAEINVSYLTKGLDWIADYVLELGEETFKLAGWVTIDNHSGTTYEDAQIKLIAGDVRRVEEDDDLDYPVLYESNVKMSEEGFTEKAFADYHMYTLQRTSTLRNNQSKQVNFLQASDVPFKKYYEYTRHYDGARITLEFRNTPEANLGMPLPKGKIKVYQNDPDDHSLEFSGEDAIGHTPRNEVVQLYLGDAFDIRCEGWKADSWKSVEGYGYETYEYNIRNQKDEAALMKITHHIYDRHWKMVDTSHDYEKETASAIVFWVKVPAASEETVTFKYRTDDRVTVKVKKDE
ncbi:DUF4139 domain-containing protein [Bacillus marinisedimentorum]|uniref:DUF4139 domain-containing protein n=1 Tax=Bacillus marinisedimentorum TaxID=1821260 RepID=UPI000872CE20|nr:DUF4139 domain-containing protein [Bacillus marinisedimentorum]